MLDTPMNTAALLGESVRLNCSVNISTEQERYVSFSWERYQDGYYYSIKSSCGKGVVVVPTVNYGRLPEIA